MTGVPRRVQTQLELPIERLREKDRNHHLGGRSFYFFDFDDNVAFLATPMILFHKKTAAPLLISSGEYARELSSIGKRGAYKDYEIHFDESFHHFRDQSPGDLVNRGLEMQLFLHDIAAALALPDAQWKGPSWSCFYHATFNQRPLSVITARGHAPQTIKDGINLFVDGGHLPQSPNFLSVFPVSHPSTRENLGDKEFKASVAELKKAAIRASVEDALKVYGYSPHHRFGMSDDDPKNIQLIHDEMKILKTDYPELSFFIIETHNEQFVKHEVTNAGLQSQAVPSSDENAVQHLLFQDE